MAELVEHADFFGEPQRMMSRQNIDKRRQAEPFCALGCGRQEDTGRWRQIQRRRMMLAHVVGPKSGLIVEFDQFQTVFVLFAERIGPTIVLIEYAELHHVPFLKSFWIGRDETGKRLLRRAAFCDGVPPLRAHNMPMTTSIKGSLCRGSILWRATAPSCQS
jgi:hypothetical protein